MQQIWGFLRLMRPANIVTAISDILAGIALSGYILGLNAAAFSISPILLLVVATIGLYGGGVVFNDVFDAELDTVERPERPIPSGLIHKNTAAFFASLLLLLGIICASIVHPEGWFSSSGLLATATAISAVVYDKWGKHHNFLGPLNMGLCRGLNLLLGMSILPEVMADYWFIGLVPVVYIAAITMISRGEVHGGNKKTLYAAALLYIVVLMSILWFSYFRKNMLITVPFVLFFGVMIFLPLKNAVHEPVGRNIGKAVKAGVISLIIMNAAWAVAVGSFGLGLIILALLPLSLFLAKLFAVT